ncbi:MAG: hypothetical protein ACYC2W_13075 [Desulfurivibrionaceae bacterium]
MGSENNPYELIDPSTKKSMGWVLVLGEITLIFETQEAALAAMAKFSEPRNEEFFELLEEGRIWEGVECGEKEDIIRALKNQNQIFTAMIMALLGAEIQIWGGGVANQLIWQAVDFCVGLYQAIHPAPPSPPSSAPRG